MKRHASSCSEKSRRVDPQVKVKRHASSEWGGAQGALERGSRLQTSIGRPRSLGGGCSHRGSQVELH